MGPTPSRWFGFFSKTTPVGRPLSFFFLAIDSPVVSSLSGGSLSISGIRPLPRGLGGCSRPSFFPSVLGAYMRHDISVGTGTGLPRWPLRS